MSYLNTDEAKLVIEEINNLIKNHYIKDEDKNLYKFSSEINNILRGIYRIKNELESGMFFIAASGGLKSGKSTLINLLSHFNVSVTKQGQETTLRPSVVFSGKDSKIITFTLRNSNIEEQQKGDIFDLCIDYIKGFDKLNIDKTLKEYDVDVKFYNLEEGNNLEIFLTRPTLGTIKEPFLIGIQLDENHLKKYEYNLLNRKVAFIDTPGIDGIISSVEGQNNKSESKNNWLMQRVDLMLFLQSSITPINATSKNYINNLVSSLDSPSLKLVHNRFSLKSWRKEKLNIDDNYESEDTAIDKAKEIISSSINNTDIDAFTVDFAKAEDGFKYDNVQLLNDSKFEDFEEDLFKIIKDNRAKIHEEKIYKSLEKIIKINTTHDEITQKTTILYVKNMIKEAKNCIDNEKNLYINRLNLIEAFFCDKENIKYYIENAKFDDQEFDDGWALNSLSSDLKNRDWSEELSIRVNSKIDDLESSLKEVNNEIEDKIKNQLKNTKFNIFIENYYITNDSKLLEVREYINTLDKIKVKPFIFNYNNEIKGLDINIDNLYSRDTFLNKVKQFFNNKLSQDDVNAIKREFNILTKKRIEKIVEQYKLYIFDEIDNQFDSYVDYLSGIKTEINKYFDEKYEAELKRLENSSKLLYELKIFFDKLAKMI